MQATITPCSTTANDMPREGLVVVQVIMNLFIYLFIINIFPGMLKGKDGYNSCRKTDTLVNISQIDIFFDSLKLVLWSVKVDLILMRVNML